MILQILLFSTIKKHVPLNMLDMKLAHFSSLLSHTVSTVFKVLLTVKYNSNGICSALITSLLKYELLTLSCPGMGRAVVKIGHSNLRTGNKDLISWYYGTCS